MSKDAAEITESRWARLGAMFNVAAARQTVDVERLLLDTARHAHTNIRLVILAVSWLAQYGQCVARHRLVDLILGELEEDYHSVMGLVLELAKEKGEGNSSHFNAAIEACRKAEIEGPLLDSFRRNDFFVDLAKQNASQLSRKWGRWIEDFELKTDAIRPVAWIIAHNPNLRWRADFGGDLRASILAELAANPGAGASESELARSCGVSRAAVVEAVAKLERSGRIKRQKVRNRMSVQLIRRPAAA